MLSVPVVFDGVWKKFCRGERHDSLRDLLPALARRLAGSQALSELDHEEFWALRDVSFEVRPGEALGVIGPNGAGKSTVLKLLTRILKPTRGRSAVTGRIGALIEVAAGFHPDLTGRENVYLQGAIMGMKRAEIALRFDEIVEFAGVSPFIDTPVKRYSSGMNARLGFAVAAHLNPKVLVIDEVLSVGDMAFQQRCVERMVQFKRQGTAIVFVSHNLHAVAGLCERALLLRSGAVEAHGRAADVLDEYLTQDRLSRTTDRASASASRFEVLSVTHEGEGTLSQLAPGDRIRVQARLLELRVPLTECILALQVTSRITGEVVYNDNVYPQHFLRTSIADASAAAVDIRFTAHLLRGRYKAALYVFHQPTQTFVIRDEPLLEFIVHEIYSYEGVADLGVRFAVTSVADAEPIASASQVA